MDCLIRNRAGKERVHRGGGAAIQSAQPTLGWEGAAIGALLGPRLCKVQNPPLRAGLQQLYSLAQLPASRRPTSCSRAASSRGAGAACSASAGERSRQWPAHVPQPAWPSHSGGLGMPVCRHLSQGNLAEKSCARTGTLTGRPSSACNKQQALLPACHWRCTRTPHNHHIKPDQHTAALAWRGVWCSGHKMLRSVTCPLGIGGAFRFLRVQLHQQVHGCKRRQES